MSKGVYIRTDEMKANFRIGAQKRSNDPNWRKNNKKHLDYVNKDSECKKNQKLGCERRSQDLEWREMMSNRNKEMSKDIEWIRKNKEHLERIHKDLGFLQKQSKSHVQLHKDGKYVNMYKSKKWIDQHNKVVKRCAQDPIWINNHANAMKELAQTIEWQNNRKIAIEKTIEWRENNVASNFWYGSVKNDLTLNQLIRRLTEYKLWINRVLERDGYKDKITGEFCIRPEAHHIMEVHKIIKKYNLRTLDDARNCLFLWDINNGECLEHDNHIKIHGFSYDEDEE
jgi:hypothetical protein